MILRNDQILKIKKLEYSPGVIYQLYNTENLLGIEVTIKCDQDIDKESLVKLISSLHIHYKSIMFAANYGAGHRVLGRYINSVK